MPRNHYSSAAWAESAGFTSISFGGGLCLSRGRSQQPSVSTSLKSILTRADQASLKPGRKQNSKKIPGVAVEGPTIVCGDETLWAVRLRGQLGTLTCFLGIFFCPPCDLGPYSPNLFCFPGLAFFLVSHIFARGGLLLCDPFFSELHKASRIDCD